MTFFVEVEETYNREGVRIGTIVEGADAEPEVAELWFPFTTEVLRDEIQRIEDEADEIWQEWNNDKIRRLLRLS